MRTRLINTALSACFGMIIIVTIFTLGPWLETKFFPVYSKFRIVSIEPALDGKQSFVTFEFAKLRQCNPKGFVWFFGEPGAAFRQLNVEANQQRQSNGPLPIGIHRSRQYLMDATEAELNSSTFAEIFNECHPFWTTKSEIYP